MEAHAAEALEQLERQARLRAQTLERAEQLEEGHRLAAELWSPDGGRVAGSGAEPWSQVTGYKGGDAARDGQVDRTPTRCSPVTPRSDASLLAAGELG
eukprot:5121211-Alexandrium_andersonii.AAC.1